MHLYGVFDKDGNMVYSGTGRQLVKKYDFSPSSLYSYYSGNCKLKRMYDVRVIGEYEAVQEIKQEGRKLTKHERLIQYYVSHLKKYGNVYSKENPEPYLTELKELGYDVEITAYTRLKDDFVINAPIKDNKRKRYVIDYVLQVKR